MGTPLSPQTELMRRPAQRARKNNAYGKAQSAYAHGFAREKGDVMTVTQSIRIQSHANDAATATTLHSTRK